MTPEYVPLLSPKPFSEFSPEEFQEYVRSLYVEPERPPPPADFSVRLNQKGTPVITVRRKPKWLTASEVQGIALDLGLPLQTLWILILRRKIEIRVPQPQLKGKRGKR